MPGVDEGEEDDVGENAEFDAEPDIIETKRRFDELLAIKQEADAAIQKKGRHHQDTEALLNQLGECLV